MKQPREVRYTLKSTVNEYQILEGNKRLLGTACLSHFINNLPEPLIEELDFQEPYDVSMVTPIYNQGLNWIFSVNGQEKFYSTQEGAEQQREAYIQRINMKEVRIHHPKFI